MSAYTYVTKVKQAEMESGFNPASTTPSVAIAAEKHRSKRQAVPTDCVEVNSGMSNGVPAGASRAQAFAVYNCSDGTGFIDFTSCDNITVRSPRLPFTTIQSNVDTTKDVYYNCFHHVCADGCNIYSDGINAMIAERGCIENSDTTAIGLAAQTVATYCKYSDSDCNMGAVAKPSNVYNGWCFSETCGYGLTMSCDDCTSGQLTYTHNVDPSCDTTKYISDMIPEVTNAMAGSDCGDSCTPSPCAFDNPDPCKGLNYNRWLCAISMCNVSTTSWFTSTTTVAETITTLISTTEATTTEQISTSTIPDTTTTDVTSTTPESTTEISTTSEPASSTTEVLTTTTTTTGPTSTVTETMTTTPESLTSTTDALSSSTTATFEATTTTTARTTETSTLTIVTTTDPMTTIEPTSSTPSSTTSSEPETTTVPQLSTTTAEPTTSETIRTTSETTVSTTSTPTISSTTTATESTMKQQTTPTIAQTTSTTSEATTTVAATSTEAGTTSTRPTDISSPSTLRTISTSTAKESTISDGTTTDTESKTSPETVGSTTTIPSATTTVIATASTMHVTTPPTYLSSSTTSSTVHPQDITTTASKNSDVRTSTGETSEGSTGQSFTTLAAMSTTAPSSILSSLSTAETSTAATSSTTRKETTTTTAGKTSTSQHNPTALTISESTGEVQSTLATVDSEATSASIIGSGSATDLDGTTTTVDVETATTTGGDLPGSDDEHASSQGPPGRTSPHGRESTRTIASTSVSTTRKSSSSNKGSSTIDPSDLNVPGTRTSVSTKRHSGDGETSARSIGPADGGKTPSTSSTGKTIGPSTTTARGVSSKTTSHRIPTGFTTGDSCKGCEEPSATTNVAANPSNSDSSKVPNEGQWWSTSEKGRSVNRSTTANPAINLISSSRYPTKPSKTTAVPSNASNIGQRNTTAVLPNSPTTSKMNGSDAPHPSSARSDNAGNLSTRKPGSDDEWPTTPEQGQKSEKTTPSKDPRQNNGFNVSTKPPLNDIMSTKPLTTTRTNDDEIARTSEDGSEKGGTQNSADPQRLYSTASPNVHGSDSGHEQEKYRSTTPISSRKSTNKGAENGDRSDDPLSTARTSGSGGGWPTTTNYENYLKNIKLNLSSDFSLSDLTPDQKRDLEALSAAYGLDPNNDVVVIDAFMKQALQTVAAKMSPELRQILGFQLKDLVSACIINGDPCEDSDFEQTFDVDYGNCYTFNYAQEPVKYIAKSCGTSHGLHMTIMANASEQLASSVESGVKVVVHDQNLAPFPNVEGFKSPTGQLASLIVTYSRFSRLGAPYGECSTLDSIAKDNQPFYFNGTYSTEGCFRSCFQRNLATACGCADSRFPSPTDMDVPFCDPLDPPKYQCQQAYVQDKGDYFFVDNCDCYDACEDATYRTQISEAVWPSGTFFYAGFCPTAKQMNSADCTQFYSENGMTLEVSFGQLGYESLEEEPASTAWDLVNNLAGNTGLWIGYTMLSFTECVLIAIQVVLWVCRCPKELPEVPSCRYRNFFAEEDEDSSSDESSVEGDVTTSVPYAASSGDYHEKAEETFDSLWAGNGTGSVVSPTRIPPKNFDNSIYEKVLSRREVRAAMPSSLDLYDRKHQLENVDPVAARTTDYGNHVTHEELF